jgi:hypothetical protein
VRLRTTWLLVVASALLVTATASAHRSTSAPRPVCGNGTTVVQRGDVRIYRGRKARQVEGNLYFACIRGRRAVYLTTATGAPPWALNKHAIAWEYTSPCDPYSPCYSRIQSANLATGRSLSTFAISSIEGLTGWRVPIKKLQVDSHGRAAWVADTRRMPAGVGIYGARDLRTVQVHVMDAGGEEMPAASSAVVPRSLQLHSGGAVTWRQGSQTARYQLGRRDACSRRQSSTLVRNAIGRVYWVNGNVFGCSDGRTVFMGPLPLAPTYPYGYRGGFPTMAGAVVAMDFGRADRDGGESTDLRVWNLSTGQRVHRWMGYERLATLVLSPSGAVAWGTAYALRKSDATGEGVLLDERRGGPSPEFASFLKLTGNELTWTNEGVAHSATLE